VSSTVRQDNVPGIYANRDVAGPPMLAPQGEHEAWSASRHQGLHRIPRTRTSFGLHLLQPQIASVGLTEAKAKRRAAKFASAASRLLATAGDPLGEDQGWSGDLRQEDRPAPGAHMVAPR